MNRINIPHIKDLNINGVVHIGAGTGELAEFYYTIGVHQVIWIEKKQELYPVLYQNASKFAMKQLYYFPELKATDFNNKEITFKTLWRKNACDIDIETYDLLTINNKGDVTNVLDGFENFKNNFKFIALTYQPTEDVHNYLNHIGYNLDVFTEHCLYRKVI